MLYKNSIQEIYKKRERTPAEDFIFNTLEDIENIKNRFVVIGCRLVEAVRNDYYIDLGYKDIVELSENVFGLKKSMTYALMNIAKYFCIGMELREHYKSFNQSQLIEIAQCPAYLQSSITSDMSVQDIRDYRKILSGCKTSYNGIFFEGNAKKIVDTYREDQRVEAETKKNLEFFKNSGRPENSSSLENMHKEDKLLNEDNNKSPIVTLITLKEELIKYFQTFKIIFDPDNKGIGVKVTPNTLAEDVINILNENKIII